jgi:hypothetical protein
MRPTRTHELRVAPRNLRWEVSCDGVTRRMIDWLFSKERAIEHAFERAQEIARWDGNADFEIVVTRPDGTVEERHSIPAANLRSLRAS